MSTETTDIDELARRLEQSYLAGEPTPPYAAPMTDREHADREALAAAQITLRDIALIASGSTTANSLRHIARLARAELRKTAPYPFCRHPEQCTAGRCMSEIVCND